MAAQVRAPSVNLTYHLIEFDQAIEAAAFLAALSRFLNSPQGGGYLVQPDSVEAWWHSTPTPGVVGVYLSAGALEAATAAFAPVPVASTRPGEALPTDCALVVDGNHTPACGLADVQRRLLS